MQETQLRHGINNGNSKRSIRKFYQFDKNIKTIFLFGGSQGMAFLNSLMEKLILKMKEFNLQIIWQTGDKEYLKFKKYNSKINKGHTFHT